MPSPFHSTGQPIRDFAFFGPEQTCVPTPEDARTYCSSLARAHYENFSVVTFLLPRGMKPHFYAVYAFCRWADDLGDETEAAAPQMLAWWETLLDRFYTELDAPADARTVIHPVFVALHDTVREFGMPKQLFADLLVAFRQDQAVKAYATRDALLAYCRYSANPVGRMILHLARTTDEESLRMADAVCTGLQLANFWQDVARDWEEKRRVYLPREDCRRFGVTDEMLAAGKFTPELGALMEAEVAWAKSFFEAGKTLAGRVPRAFSLDIRLFRDGGLAILEEIRRRKYDVWTQRPTVSKWRKIRLLMRNLICRK